MLRYLDEHDPLVTLAELEGGQTILRETFTALPRENPLRVVSGVSRFAAIPQADREQIRVVGFGFDHTMELAAVSSSRINVGFEPATSDDAQRIAGFGGLLDTPLFAAELRPVLSVDGEVVAKGGSAPLGTFFDLFVDFSIRGGSLGFASHVVTTGGMYAIVLDTQRTPTERLDASRDRLEASRRAGLPLLSDDVLGEGLHLMGLAWHRYNEIFGQYAVETSRGRLFRPLVSEALVGQDLTFRREGGALRASLGQQFIDVKRNVLSMVSRDGDPRFPRKALFLTSGAAGSALEHGIFRKLLGAPATSTEFYLQEAAGHDMPIYSVDGGNAAEVVPQLELPEFARQLVLDSVAAGLKVIVHGQQPRFFGSSTGVGLIAYDPVSGAGSFLITRSIFGGQRLLTEQISQMSSEEQESFLAKSLDFLWGFTYGAIVGDFDKAAFQDGATQAGRLLGQIVSGILVYGDVRDVVANAIEVGESGGAEGKVDLTLSGVGFIPVLGDFLKSAKYADELIDIAAGTAKNVPAEEAVGLFKGTADDLAGAGTGVADDAGDTIVELAQNADEGLGDVTSQALKSSTSTVAKTTVNGLEVELRSVDDAETLVKDLVPDLPVDLKGVTAAQKGAIGEKLCDVIAQERGWTKVSSEAKNPTTTGLDAVYQKPDGTFVIVESKFTSSTKNVGTGTLSTKVSDGMGGKIKVHQLADDWLLKTVDPNDPRTVLNMGAIARSVEEGTVSKELAEVLAKAVAEGKVDKELVIVRNNDTGNTVTQALGNHAGLGTGSAAPIRVTQVNLGKIVN